MADKCAGCTNKYGFFERPSVCPECHRGFCQSCLPYRGKKVKKSQPQVSLEACVYCTRQKAVNKTEEAEILRNFKDRYYDRAHLEAPIQSTLRLDLVMRQHSAPGSTSPSSAHKPVQLTGEDRALEERLRKLKEDRKAAAPSYSEEEMQQKLERLRDEGDEKKPTHEESRGDEGEGGKMDTNHQTQTEQADRLMEQAADEVKLDSQLNQEGDEELLRRFQALKGDRSASADTKKRPPPPKVDLDIQQLLDKMELPSLEEQDPEQLLRDLQAVQTREEAAALRELGSDEVQGLLKEAQSLAKEEQSSERGDEEGALANIVYPKFLKEENSETQDADLPPPEASVGGDDASGQVAKLLEEGREELQLEEEQRQADLAFIKQSSERLGELRGGGGGGDGGGQVMEDQIPEDEVVKSKPKPVTGSSLDFSWGHFGTQPPAGSAMGPPGPSSALSAANQLGIGGPSSQNGEELFDEEVQNLIARMLEESELDNRLEASGLNYRPESSEQSSDSTRPDHTPSSSGATALTPPPAAAAVGGGACAGGGSHDHELPWCCICNDDATICCYDCDSDLYCQRCFSEGHQQFGLYDHQYTPFEPPGKSWH